ncbi:hypothetical protein FDP41_010362 [Naegleria fowleri]|uniref:RecA family profile 1 domain-containing protein n=1 Tax=Naegleria fowleri TaxID=5763 RepID=A0A6A5C1I6_NAEFO|nr:uncharacterized protein FDP41_010362 [Naegleria fowleri]KAF0983297.1 hypothetical protein FDP41_010362 [Naegleria fowleri]
MSQQVPESPQNSWQDQDEVPESPTITPHTLNDLNDSTTIATSSNNNNQILTLRSAPPACFSSTSSVVDSDQNNLNNNSSGCTYHDHIDDSDLIIDDELYKELLQDENHHMQSLLTTNNNPGSTSQSDDDNSDNHPSNDSNTTNTSYEYQDGFSLDIHHKSIENILDILYSSDYPPPPLQLIENDETYDFPFPTKSQLSHVFRTMKILFLFTFLTRCLSDKDQFKREILSHLSTFKVLHRGFRMNHVDIICHDIIQQVLLRAPMKLTEIIKLSSSTILNTMSNTLNTMTSSDITTTTTTTLNTTTSPTIINDAQNESLTTPSLHNSSLTTLPTLQNNRSIHEFLSFGDPILDELFETSISKRDGIYGIPIKATSGGFIIELSGVAGSGKTQLALHLTLQCLLNRKFGGLNSKVLYLHSESYPMDRLNEMIEAKTRQLNEYYSRHHSQNPIEFSKDYFLNNIIQRNISNTNEFNDLLKPNITSMSHMSPLENVIEKKNIRLVILDSIGMLFRDSHASRKSTIERSETLQFQIQHMKYLATKYKIIFLILNQVSAIFEDDVNHELVRKYHQSHPNDTLNCEEALECYLYDHRTLSLGTMRSGDNGGGATCSSSSSSNFYNSSICDDSDGGSGSHGDHLNDDDSLFDSIGDISSVRSYFKLTPSEKVKPTLGLHWSSLIDIRLFLTKLNRRDVVIASRSRLRRDMKKFKPNDHDDDENSSPVYLRDYETQEPKYESVNDYSRQIHVIYSPFSPTTSRSFLIDSFGVRGV